MSLFEFNSVVSGHVSRPLSGVAGQASLFECCVRGLTDLCFILTLNLCFFTVFASEALAAASTDAGKNLHSRFVSAVSMLTG